MKGIHYITNDEGIKTALLFDLNEFRKTKKTGAEIIEYLETLEDIIDFELRVHEPLIPYSQIRNDLIKQGKLKK